MFASVLILSLTVIGAFAFTKLGRGSLSRRSTSRRSSSRRGSRAPSPEQIETEITDRIEEAVNTISGIDELRSVSSEGVSQVIVSFILEKDVDVAAQEVRDKVNRVLPLLPQDDRAADGREVRPRSSPILTLAVSSQRSRSAT